MNKILVLLLTLAVAFCIAPAMAEITPSAVAPAPTSAPQDSAKQVGAQPDSTIKLSSRNGFIYKCDPSTQKWHVYVYVDLPRAVVWDGGKPGAGPYTVYLAGINNVYEDPADTGVTKDQHVVEFVIDPCECGGDGLYLRLEAADGATGWPFTWKHPSRANNGTTGGYRVSLGEDCTSRYLTE
ncbi:MAG: hypothetical protein PHH01_03845 [Patescibacteria group bacterium]|nr:hypothetical protein [Patescibacteria group bacterium]